MKVEEKESEHKPELEAVKETEQCKKEYMGKSIQELDLSDCECCTPSYRLLPADVSFYFQVAFWACSLDFYLL